MLVPALLYVGDYPQVSSALAVIVGRLAVHCLTMDPRGMAKPPPPPYNLITPQAATPRLWVP